MKKIVTLFFLLLIGVLSNAQDMHFTQYYAAPLYLNPAFTGANTCSRGNLTYRNQWPGISKAYKSFLVSGEHFFSKQRLGVGLLIGNDEAGSAQLRTSIVVPSVAYEITVNRSTSIRFGLQPGIGMRSVNYSRFLFGDQIARGNNSASVENMIKSKVFFDANAGALLYNSNYYIGLSVFHINKPNESLLDDKSRLPIKYSLQGGFTYKLSPERLRDKLKEKNLSMAFHARGQN